MLFSIIAEIVGKYLDRFRESKDFKERKKIIYQVIFWGVSGTLSLILYIPPGLSIAQIFSAIVVFFLIIYFPIRTLKYFKIL
ncbi:MAG: hypothetical protein CBE33_02880 [Candidatus Pelagibacter sp. TMED273]|nr:MAG: hypothetical protein CBE33_02880 [Candidatus Pelagibacter sp. TMED273]|tara:strand:+ start:79 stop:324 length:246 start_codon:yes stop_codon:yes gene_type:complete